MPPEDHEDLKRLGERIEAAERNRPQKATRHETTPLAIAFRLSTEMVGGLIVGIGMGMSVDWAFDHWSHWHTRPWGLIVMCVLGAAVGIKNVFAAAKEINADMAKDDVEK